MTPEGDLILERVIGGEEIDDEQMGELLNLFQDYDSGKYDPGYISELALNRFAGHFITDKDVLRTMRLKRSVKTMLPVVNKFFQDRDDAAKAEADAATRKIRRLRRGLERKLRPRPARRLRPRLKLRQGLRLKRRRSHARRRRRVQQRGWRRKSCGALIKTWIESYARSRLLRPVRWRRLRSF